jgi:hypothetical protein
MSRTVPMRLACAAREVMGDQAPSVAWLRKQAAAGKLDIWRIAGKDYTTPDAIRELLDRCRAPRESDCGSAPPTAPARQPGSSETGDGRLALAALRERARKLNSASPPTSQNATSPNGSAAVTLFPSR